MKSTNYFYAIVLSLSIVSCSNSNEAENKEANQVTKIESTVDTTNILVALICQDEKWGYLNSDLKIQINPQFDKAMPFSEGLASFKQGEKWGFINIKGEIVIAPRYDEPGLFHDGLAKVANMASSSNGSLRYFFINTKGDDVFDKKFRRAEDFNNGVTMVADVQANDNENYFINTSGVKLDSVEVNKHPLLYNHFKHTTKPYGGDVHKSLKLDQNTGNPVDVIYDKDKMGYSDEVGKDLTGAIYNSAGEFVYSFKTPQKYLSSNKNGEPIADVKSELTEEFTFVSGACSDDGCTFVFRNASRKEFISSQLPEKSIEFTAEGEVKPKYLNKKYILNYQLKNVHHESSNSDDLEMLISKMVKVQ